MYSSVTISKEALSLTAATGVNGGNGDAAFSQDFQPLTSEESASGTDSTGLSGK